MPNTIITRPNYREIDIHGSSGCTVIIAPGDEIMTIGITDWQGEYIWLTPDELPGLIAALEKAKEALGIE